MNVECFSPKGGWVKVPEDGIIYSAQPYEFVKALLRRDKCVVVSIRNTDTAVVLESLRLHKNRYEMSSVAFTGGEIWDGDLSALLLELNLPVEAIQF